MRDDTPAGTRAAQSWGQGRWFPSDARQLATTVDRFVESAVVPAIPGRLVATVAPHAGYEYSGAVAGHTYRAMRDMAREAPPEVVVVLGFCHRASFPGIALLEGAAMRTPLGLALLDPALGEALVAASDVYRGDSEAHVGEHSAENQIPFLQRALPGVRLVSLARPIPSWWRRPYAGCGRPARVGGSRWLPARICCTMRTMSACAARTGRRWP
jgi:AmmeMemoRadiSam system protein B